MNKKVLLLILDGWGVTQDPAVSAISNAHTPYIDSLYKSCPNAQLLTHGMHVGLPEGQMGNSEVGHMNLGAGRIVYQDLAKVNLAVQNNTLKDAPALKSAFHDAKENNKKIHLLGLVSDGGVHSHIDHLKGLLDVASEFELDKVFVHAFTDGRDVDPHSGAGHIQSLLEHMQQSTGQLASIVGRYYAMDRDRRWERIKLAYDLLVKGVGSETENAVAAIHQSYDNQVSDEFIKPIVCTKDGNAVAIIEPGDTVIFFNFRTDRGRQLTEVLTQKDHPDHAMATVPLRYVTLTNYDDTFKNIEVVYQKEHINRTLGEVLADLGKTQIRIAETEKYPHVTFFFSGGREEPFEGEKRILCPSPKVATYDLQPEMSAFEVRDRILPELKDFTADFICLNFANPDMVGHTGDFQAAIKACETVDNCVSEIVETAKASNYSVLILADHGNSETMKNPDGSPHTAHTTNPVPVILVDEKYAAIKNGILGDIAPTILTLMGVSIPREMTGNPLV